MPFFREPKSVEAGKAKSTAPLLGDQTREQRRRRADRQNYLIQIALGVLSVALGSLFLVFLLLHQRALVELKTQKANAKFEESVDSNLVALGTRLDRLSTRLDGLLTRTNELSTQMGRLSTHLNGLPTQMDTLSTKVRGLSTVTVDQLGTVASQPAAFWSDLPSKTYLQNQILRMNSKSWIATKAPGTTAQKSELNSLVEDFMLAIDYLGPTFSLVVQPQAGFAISSALDEALYAVADLAFGLVLKTVVQSVCAVLATDSSQFPSFFFTPSQNLISALVALYLDKSWTDCNSMDSAEAMTGGTGDQILYENIITAQEINTEFSLPDLPIDIAQVYAAATYLGRVVATTKPNQCFSSLAVTALTSPNDDIPTVRIQIAVEGQEC